MAASGGAFAQDEPRVDNSGKGAVLCLQQVLPSAKAVVEACGWERTSTDDAIDNALTDIDAFVIANSSQPVTQEQINQFKSEQLDDARAHISAEPGVCSRDPKASDDGLFWAIHTMDVTEFVALTADALSIPREPVLNPCF